MTNVDDFEEEVRVTIEFAKCAVWQNAESNRRQPYEARASMEMTSACKILESFIRRNPYMTAREVLMALCAATHEMDCEKKYGRQLEAFQKKGKNAVEMLKDIYQLSGAAMELYLTKHPKDNEGLCLYAYIIRMLSRLEQMVDGKEVQPDLEVNRKVYKILLSCLAYDAIGNKIPEECDTLWGLTAINCGFLNWLYSDDAEVYLEGKEAIPMFFFSGSADFLEGITWVDGFEKKEPLNDDLTEEFIHQYAQYVAKKLIEINVPTTEELFATEETTYTEKEQYMETEYYTEMVKSGLFRREKPVTKTRQVPKTRSIVKKREEKVSKGKGWLLQSGGSSSVLDGSSIDMNDYRYVLFQNGDLMFLNDHFIQLTNGSQIGKGDTKASIMTADEMDRFNYEYPCFAKENPLLIAWGITPKSERGVQGYTGQFEGLYRRLQEMVDGHNEDEKGLFWNI